MLVQGRKPDIKVTKEEVYGVFDTKLCQMTSKGMVVARYDDICPIWGDLIGYKSHTIVCPLDVVDDVVYWMMYVNGAEPSKEKDLGNGTVALRGDYACW